MHAHIETIRKTRSRQGLFGVLVFGWTGTIVAAMAAIVVSFFLFGYWYPYWRRADMDFMMVYQGFLLNDGRPQDFFDHPGHLNVLLTDVWFRLLHGIGALKVIALSDIPPAADSVNFELVWTAAVRAGRLLSLVLVLCFVGVFAALLRRLVADWRIAALGILMLALSSAVMWHARVIRTDLLAAGLEFAGLLLLLEAARSPDWRWRPAVVGIAVMLCTLGVVNKVQAILLALAWTVVAMFFGVRGDNAGSSWHSPRRAIVPIALLAAAALLTAIPAADLIRLGLVERPASLFPFPPPPFGIVGLYQAMVAAWVVAAILAFAAIWRVPPLETIATLLAALIGVCTGLLALDIRYHPQNVLSVVNPIEHMMAWASFSDPQLATGDGVFSSRLFQSLVFGIADVFARFTFVLHFSTRATVFLQWLVCAGMVMAWRRGERLLVGQVGILLAAAWGLDAVGTLRDLHIEYAIYADPLVVIAACWLLANFSAPASHRLAFPLGALLLTVNAVFGQFEPIKQGLRRAGPESTCSWLPRHIRLVERFPFCPPKT
ncbi:MAG: hypothetical protein ACJ8D9_18185 [Xanthobacteraceae bacterium]